MPQPYKGLRVRAYTRLPADVYAQAARLAEARGWDMSTWLANAAKEQTRREQK